MFDSNAIVWTPGMTLELMEELIIQRSYRFHRQNKTSTSKTLGISIRTLDAKLKKYEEKELLAVAAKKETDERTKTFLDRQRGVCTNNVFVGNGVAK